MHFAERGQARIHYRSWGRRDRPVLLLLHGFRGHARWWDFIAPFFAADFRVLAADLSGMGDSGHRSSYSHDTFTEDIGIVLDHAGAQGASAVGHSFGGAQLLRACAKLPDRFERAVIVDSYLNLPGDSRFAAAMPPYRLTTYPTQQAALARFRLLPEQPAPLAYATRHVAMHSMRETESGWRWKFDPSFTPEPFEEDTEAMLRAIDIPVHFLLAEHSRVVARERAERITRCLQGGRPPIVLPDTHHHVMLDKPLMLVATLRALLS